jgi:multidrug transporter EmrE-like cation transporter
LLVAVIGVLWLKEHFTLMRSLSALLIVAGVAGMYLSGSE